MTGIFLWRRSVHRTRHGDSPISGIISISHGTGNYTAAGRSTRSGRTQPDGTTKVSVYVTRDTEKGLLDTLDIWDIQLAEYGEKLIETRNKFINQVNEIISDIHCRLTGNTEKIEVSYEPDTGEMSLLDSLKKYRERDMRMKSTTCGPHRDDICFVTNGIDIRKFGSQGQQRTAALSLKLSEIELVKMSVKDTPVLLLDDVLSELDKYRQNYLLESIHDIQTLITCTGVDEFVNKRFSVNKVFHVHQGHVTMEN